jgi:hypothetical protein
LILSKTYPKIAKIRVYHAHYGCDTGCCGHNFELFDEAGKEVLLASGRSFQFEHKYGNEPPEAWARLFVEDTLRAEAPECLNSIDWDTLVLDYADVAEDC